MNRAEYASDSLLKLTSDNVEKSHLDSKTLDRRREAGRVTPRAIRDLQLQCSLFLAGGDVLVPGYCLHDELEWFTGAGFSAVEALQTATINPARFLGRESLQRTIQVGK